MIEFLRRKMSFFIWAIVGAFVLSLFVGSASLLWFIGDQPSRKPTEAPLATPDKPATDDESGELDVNSTKIAGRITLDGKESIITEGELNRRLQEHDLFKQTGGKVPPQLKKFFMPQLLDGAVDQRILAMRAEAESMDVSGEVDKQMKELYERMGGPEKVAAMGVDEAGIRRSLAERLRYARFIERVVGGRQVSDGEIQAYYDGFRSEFTNPDGTVRPLAEVRDEIVRKLRSHVSDEDVARYYEQHKDRWLLPTTVSFRRVAVDPTAERRLAAVTFKPEELKAYYDSHGAEFAGPKRYLLRHVFLDPASPVFADAVTVGEDEVAARYDEQRDDYFEEEQVKTANILVAVAEGGDVDAATAKAEAALARIRGGEAFEAVAKEVSEDVVTKARGGEGGFWAQGMKEPAVEDAVFHLDPGAVAGPVRTERGVELFKVLERKPAATKSLDEVRDEIVSVLKRDRAEEKVKERLEGIKTRVQAGETTLEAAAREFSQAPSGAATGGLLTPMALGRNEGATGIDEVGERGYLDYNLQGKLRSAAAGDLIGPVRSSRGYHLMKVEEILPASTRPFDEVKAEVEKKYRAFLAEQEAQQLAGDVAQRLRAGELTAEAAVATYSDGADRSSGGLWKNLVLDAATKPDMPADVLAEADCQYGLNDAFVNALKPLQPGGVSRPIRVKASWNVLVMVDRAAPAYAPLDDEAKKAIRFALNPDVTDEELRTYFDEHRDEFKTPAKVVIQHVMCPTKDKAETVLAKALEGEDFDGLVAEFTIDGASKRRQGIVEQEQLPPAFTEAVDKVEAGQVVPGVIESPAGFHVVRLVKRETAREPSFADAKDQIREKILRPRLAELLQDYVKELRRSAVVETWDGPEHPLSPTNRQLIEAPHLTSGSPDLKKPAEGAATGSDR